MGVGIVWFLVREGHEALKGEQCCQPVRMMKHVRDL
jgi:hypothetical protein